MIEDGDEYNSTIDYIRRNGRSISTGGEYPTWAFIYMIHSATFFIEKEKDHGYLDEMVRKNTNKETSYIKGRLVQYDKINYIFLYNYQMGEIWHHVNQTLAQEIKDYVQRYTKMTVDCVVDEDKKLIVEKKDWDMKYQNDLFEAECFMKIQEEEKLGKAQVFEYNLERVSPTKWSLLKEGKVFVPPKRDYDAPHENSDGYEGAMVLKPVPGLYKWVACFDYASLYPTTIRQYNISPDVYLGKNIENTTDIKTINNCYFKKNKDGVLRTAITNLFTDRKTNKNIAMEIETEIKFLQDEYKKRKIRVKV